MRKVIIILSIIFVIYACSSGGSEQSSSGSLARPAINSTIDLRLGQVSSGSSVVAVSAALQNGESISVFSQSNNTLDAIYVSPNSQSVLVNFDQLGRPNTAQFENATVSYTNYTRDNTVDITIQTNESSRTAKTIFLANQPIDQNTLDFLNSDTLIEILLGTNQDLDSGIRSVLAATVGALKVIACGTDEFLDNVSDFIPQGLLTNICSSTLLNRTSFILEFTDYSAILLNLKNYEECKNPTNLEQKITCAALIAQEIAPQVPDLVASNSSSNTGASSAGETASTTGETSTGTTGDSNTGGTTDGSSTGGTNNSGGNTGGANTGGTNTGGTSTGGTNTGGTNTGGTNTGGTNTGGNTGGGGGGLLGRWSGTGQSNGTQTSGCSTYDISFSVKSKNNDASCATRCELNGTLSEGKVPIDFTLKGTVFGGGNYSFTGDSTSPNITISVTGDLSPENLPTSFGYVYNNINCSATFRVTKD